MIKKTCIINSAEPGNFDFTGPIQDVFDNMGIVSEIIQWHALQDREHLDGFGAAIISASPMGDNANFKERIRSFGWLKSVQFPVLGICAGHQFIGHIFGGTLISDIESEEGPTPVKLTRTDRLFEGLDMRLSVQQQHHDSVSLPPGFLLLASSERCMVQAMRHPVKPIYGIQWHAEISTPEIIRNLVLLKS